jgi:hypothetical protein
MKYFEANFFVESDDALFASFLRAFPANGTSQLLFVDSISVIDTIKLNVCRHCTMKKAQS